MKKFFLALLAIAVPFVSFCDDDDRGTPSGILALVAKNQNVSICSGILNDKEILFQTGKITDTVEGIELYGYTCVFNIYSFSDLVQWVRKSDGTRVIVFEDIQDKLMRELESKSSATGKTTEKLQILGIASQMISYNNASMASSLANLMAYCIGKMPFITDKDVDVLHNVDRRLKEVEKKSKDGDDNRIRELQTQINGLRTTLTSNASDVQALQRQISQSSSLEEVNALRVELSNKMADMTKNLVTVDMMKDALDKVIGKKDLPLVGISGGDVGFSNMVAEVSLYLGADKADMTNSLAFTPPKLRGKRQDEGGEESEGEVAENIIAYLNSYGVVAFDDGEGEGKNGFDHIFEASVSGGKTNITANFNAPANWVDGATIQLTNGQYTVVGGNGAWWYDNVSQAFKDCSVQIGSHSINNASIPYSTAGNVYALITYGGSGTPTITLHSTDSYVDGVSISVWVGTLIPSPNGEGVVAQRWRGNGIVIFCYE